MRSKKGRGLKLAGAGKRINYLKRAARKHGPGVAKYVAKNYLIPAAKSYLSRKQSGGFVFTTAVLIAGAIAAAKAAALGAAGALGALSVNKMAGRGVNPAHVRAAIEKVKLTIKDFSPSAHAKIQRATQILNNNPNALARVSKMLEPIIKMKLSQKLREYGITGQGGKGLSLAGGSFRRHLASELRI